MTNKFEKSAESILDYKWDWTQRLAAGETIKSAQVIIPAGVSLSSMVFDDTTVTAWLGGGIINRTYAVGCLIETTIVASGISRTEKRNIYLEIKDL